MVDRFLVWLGAGILTAGVSAATIAGAGLAAAEDGAAAGVGGNTSSETSNPTGAEAHSESGDDDSTIDDPGVDSEPEGIDDPDAAADTEEEAAVEDEEAADGGEATDESTADGGEATDEATDDKTESGSDDRVPARTFLTARDSAETSSGTERSAGALESDVKQAAEDSEESEEPTVEPAATETEPMPAAAAEDETVTTVDTESTPPTARVVMTALEEEEPAPAAPSLIHVIGTIAWSVFDFVSKIIEGPPVVPAGSNVTVGRSRLGFDCGDGYTTEADWYFPTEGETPTKLIYLQHGAFARAGLYNGTAAELAERNNAIVVAPSITSNYFACDACALGGDAMHAAVAKLFLDDRGALLASARAAGFEGTELPQRFVIAGHSGGGQLAGGAAGYYAQFAPADELHNLAGVLLLDTSPVGGAVERGVRKIPEDIPVYVISAAPGVMNTYGGVDEVLVGLRPGQFVGVQLVGGVHGDAWQSTNSLAEFVVGLGTGFPAPENVEAVQVLAQGWINDWFTPEDPDTGIYGDLGSVIDIPTDAGTAKAYVLPAPQRQLTVIDLFVKAILESTVLLTALQTCAETPGSGLQPALFTENSTPNTALSLDGKASKGQSVGQNVCTG